MCQSKKQIVFKRQAILSFQSDLLWIILRLADRILFVLSAPRRHRLHIPRLVHSNTESTLQDCCYSTAPLHTWFFSESTPEWKYLRSTFRSLTSSTLLTKTLPDLSRFSCKTSALTSRFSSAEEIYVRTNSILCCLPFWTWFRVFFLAPLFSSNIPIFSETTVQYKHSYKPEWVWFLGEHANGQTPEASDRQFAVVFHAKHGSKKVILWLYGLESRSFEAGDKKQWEFRTKHHFCGKCSLSF